MQLSIKLKPGEKEVEIFKCSLYAERIKIYYTILGVMLSLWGIFGFSSPYIMVGVFIFLVIVLSYATYHWLLWYFSNYILTNQRLISIEQEGIFNKEVKELQLDRILDITYEQKGMAANMAHYGTLHVIGIGLTIDLYDVSHPAEARDLILDARPENAKLLTKDVINVLNNK